MSYSESQNKHVYLILAYKQTYTLEKTLQLIDDDRNDIYIHLDSKTKNWNYDYINSLVLKSNLYYTQRTNVNWAAFSLLNAILLLCKTAYESGINYAYYHLLSESCMPLKSQDEIHNLLSECNFDYITYGDYFPERWSKYYYFFTETPKYRTSKIVKFLSRYVFLYPQIVIGIDRWKGINNKNNQPVKPVWGWTWFSLRNQTVSFLMNNFDFIKKHFNKSHASDETCISTMLHNFYTEENTATSLRNITLVDGKPTILLKDDFDRLINSNDLFARKFDENIDKEIIDRIYNYVKNEVKL